MVPFKNLSYKNELKKETLALFIKSSVSDLSANVLLATLMAIAIADYVPRSFLIIWLVLMGLILTARFLNGQYLKKLAPEFHGKADLYLNRVRFLGISTGLAWGIGGVGTYALTQSLPASLTVFISFIIGGLCAGAMIALSADFITLAGFCLLAFIPHIVHFFWSGDSLSISMGTAMLAFLAYVLMASIRYGQSYHDNLRLRTGAQQTEENLQKILEYSPISASIINIQNKQLLYANQRYFELLGIDNQIYDSHHPNLGLTNEEYQLLIDKADDDYVELDQLVTITNKKTQQKKSILVSFFRLSFHGQASLLSWFYDISDYKSMEERTEYLAYHDELTGLPNRALFRDSLKQLIEESIRKQQRFSLLFIDLDGFKAVNDDHGHDMGDQLLILVAERISVLLRKSDTVARLGGDEFAVIINDIASKTDAIQIAEKIRLSLTSPFLIMDKTLEISCSIGVACFPAHGKDDLSLLKHADQAMYQVKQHGRNNVHVYQSQN